MISEVTAAAAKVVDTVGKVVGEAAKETGKAAAKEAAKEAGKEVAKKGADITKRLDVTKVAVDVKSVGVDITQRVKPQEVIHSLSDVFDKDTVKLFKEYISDLKSKSEFADTIKSDALDISSFERVSPEQVKKLRTEFSNLDFKNDLRKEWEKRNNQEWPRYKEDVYNKNGIKVRKKGDYYDAHHIQPLSMGGQNVASNITPLDVLKHSEIHSTGGSCKKLVDKVAGGRI